MLAPNEMVDGSRGRMTRSSRVHPVPCCCESHSRCSLRSAAISYHTAEGCRVAHSRLHTTRTSISDPCGRRSEPVSLCASFVGDLT